MAEFSTSNHEIPTTNGFGNHSRRSSKSSGRSDSSKENKKWENSKQLEQLNLRGGSDLHGESRTEMSPSFSQNHGMQIPDTTAKQAVTQAPGSDAAKAAKNSALPSADITIPSDANISLFTCDQLASFLKCLKVEERIISHLHGKSVDGKRFAKMKDSELEAMGLKNPVVLFFRDKSNVKAKKKGPFML